MIFSCIFEHKWSDWIHVPTGCKDERFCVRCRKLDTKRPSHRFGLWKSAEISMFKVSADGRRVPDSEFVIRIQIRNCTSCNYQEEEKFNTSKS